MMLVCTLFAAALLAPEVTVAKTDYKGWKDCYKISNSDVELVVVPSIGRVMSYGYNNDRNLLWENDALYGLNFAPDPQTYRNYGGDKTWVAPQSLWNWPPDVFVDGQPWTVENLPNGVRLKSPAGRKVKVQFTREITLAPLGTEVTFSNSMQNLGERREMGLWQVTQMNRPDVLVLGTEMTPQQPKGWYGFGRESLNSSFQTLKGQDLIIRRSPTDTRKFGARSSKGLLTATKGSLLFTSESRVFQGAKYPDNGSAQEVYTSPDPYDYAELEHLSPLNRMERGEITFQVVKWKLAKG